MKHTPEPWDYELGDTYLSVFANDGKEGNIAEIPLKSRDGIYDDRTDEEQKANADLIISAPEMHSILLELVDDYECVAETEGKKGCRHCEIRNILNKAEGK